MPGWDMQEAAKLAAMDPWTRGEWHADKYTAMGPGGAWRASSYRRIIEVLRRCIEDAAAAGKGWRQAQLTLELTDGATDEAREPSAPLARLTLLEAVAMLGGDAAWTARALADGVYHLHQHMALLTDYRAHGPDLSRRWTQAHLLIGRAADEAAATIAHDALLLLSPGGGGEEDGPAVAAPGMVARDVDAILHAVYLTLREAGDKPGAALDAATAGASPSGS